MAVAPFQDTAPAAVNASKNPATTVVVEFYGVPRLRAGRAALQLEAGSVAEVLRGVAEACPALEGLMQADGRLSPHYLLSINGRGFGCEPEELVKPGDHLILLSADVGG